MNDAVGRRKFVKIIVEQSHDQWSACFEDTLHSAFSGEWPLEAAAKLLASFHADEFAVDEAYLIQDETRAGLIEFRIPFSQLMRIPVPSVN